MSSRKVLDSLTNPKTQKEILKETKLPARTFRFAILKLKKLGLVKESFILSDARVKIYCRNPSENISKNNLGGEKNV